MTASCQHYRYDVDWYKRGLSYFHMDEIYLLNKIKPGINHNQ